MEAARVQVEVLRGALEEAKQKYHGTGKEVKELQEAPKATPKQLPSDVHEQQPVAATPTKPARQARAEGDTPEGKAEASSRSAASRQKEPKAAKPLNELLAALEDGDRQTDRDREILPHVVATFTRHLNEAKADTSQKCRDAWVTQFLHLFNRSERNYDFMASPTFVDVVNSSEENKRS